MGRRSRKRRPVAATAGEPPATPARPSRSEQRNAEARAHLKPLTPGERPPAVTVAAVVALLLASGNLIAYAAGLTIEGKRPSLVSIAIPTVIMLVAGIGMWRAKYWAVLGFEMLLAITIILTAAVLLRASNWQAVVFCVVVLGICTPLFWFLIRAMARLQMPTRTR